MVSTASRVRLLVVTCIALFMAMLDNLVIGVALPSIQEEFHASMSDLQWFLNAYTLAFAVLLIPFSAIGDRFGRKKYSCSVSCCSRLARLLPPSVPARSSCRSRGRCRG